MTFRGGGSGGNNSVGGGASGVPRHYGSGSGMSRGGANFSHHYGRGGGPRNIVYDGKRMRKALTRRTLDYTSSMIRMLEAPQSPVTGKRYPGPLFPTPDYLLNLMPTFAYPDRPADAICTKFLHSSQNKIRVPTNICRWSPDGRRLITGASSGEITLWNGFSFNFETILQAHDTIIRSMQWSHNGNFLISGDNGGTIKIWQPSLNNIKDLNKAHGEAVRGLSFASTDLKYASSSDDGIIKIWDFATAKEERALSGHGWDVRCVDWHPMTSTLASGSKDSLIKLWDARSGTCTETIYGHKNSILDVQWNRNGMWLATTSKDQHIKIWDMRNTQNTELVSYRGHSKEINTLQWHPHHERLFATGAGDGSIMFWIVGQPREVGTLLEAHESIIWSLDWHPMGHILASCSADCMTRFWTRHRPGDTLKDRYSIGIQAAEALGISTAPEPAQAGGVSEDELFDQQQDEEFLFPGLNLNRYKS